MRISDLLQEAKELERVTLLKSLKDVLSRVRKQQEKESHLKESHFSKECSEVLHTGPSSSKRLKKLFTRLRAFYKSDGYQELKDKEDHPDVSLAHSLTLCPFTETINWSSFLKLIQPSTDGKLLQKLSEKRTALVQSGAYEKDRSLSYLIRHPHIFLRAFRSHPLGHFLLGWICPYDPRMAENYPCLLFEEKKAEGSILFSITPTPSVGLSTSLEAESLIQALANRQAGVASGCRPNLKAWIYVNLQSLRHGIEQARSTSLMELNERFENLFFGITLDVNSFFYKFYEEEQFSPVFIEQIQRWVLDKGNYSLNSPRGHFFPIPESKRHAWEKAFITMSEEAIGCLQDGTDQEKMRAYKELILVSLVRLWQGYVYGFFKQKGAPFELLSTVACKECIDRGGKLNAELVWALDKSQEDEREAKVVALFYGRALLARKRMIQKHRSDAFFDLIQCCSRPDLETLCHKAFTLGESICSSY